MPVNSGWANECGTELFTIGWVPCDKPIKGGGPDFEREHLRKQILREDEELLAVIIAYTLH